MFPDADPVERNRQRIEHAAPSIRLGHHHGVFEFQDHAANIHGHMAATLHAARVRRVPSGCRGRRRSERQRPLLLIFRLTAVTRRFRPDGRGLCSAGRFTNGRPKTRRTKLSISDAVTALRSV